MSRRERNREESPFRRYETIGPELSICDPSPVSEERYGRNSAGFIPNAPRISSFSVNERIVRTERHGQLSPLSNRYQIDQSEPDDEFSYRLHYKRSEEGYVRSVIQRSEYRRDIYHEPSRDGEIYLESVSTREIYRESRDRERIHKDFSPTCSKRKHVEEESPSISIKQSSSRRRYPSPGGILNCPTRNLSPNSASFRGDFRDKSPIRSIKHRSSSSRHRYQSPVDGNNDFSPNISSYSGSNRDDFQEESPSRKIRHRSSSSSLRYLSPGEKSNHLSPRRELSVNSEFIRDDFHDESSSRRNMERSISSRHRYASPGYLNQDFSLTRTTSLHSRDNSDVLYGEDLCDDSPERSIDHRSNSSSWQYPNPDSSPSRNMSPFLRSSRKDFHADSSSISTVPSHRRQGGNISQFPSSKRGDFNVESSRSIPPKPDHNRQSNHRERIFPGSPSRDNYNSHRLNEEDHPNKSMDLCHQYSNYEVLEPVPVMRSTRPSCFNKDGHLDSGYSISRLNDDIQPNTISCRDFNYGSHSSLDIDLDTHSSRDIYQEDSSSSRSIHHESRYREHPYSCRSSSKESLHLSSNAEEDHSSSRNTMQSNHGKIPVVSNHHLGSSSHSARDSMAGNWKSSRYLTNRSPDISQSTRLKYENKRHEQYLSNDDLSYEHLTQLRNRSPIEITRSDKDVSTKQSRKRIKSASPTTIERKRRSLQKTNTSHYKDSHSVIEKNYNRHFIGSKHKSRQTSAGAFNKEEGSCYKSSGKPDKILEFEYPTKLYEIKGKIVLIIDKLKCGVLNLEGGDGRKAYCLFFFKDVHFKEQLCSLAFKRLVAGKTFCVNARLMTTSEQIPYAATNVWEEGFDVPDTFKSKILADLDEVEVEAYYRLTNQVSLKLLKQLSVKEDKRKSEVQTIVLSDDEELDLDSKNPTRKDNDSSSSVECLKINVMNTKMKKKHKIKESKKHSRDLNINKDVIEGIILSYSQDNNGLVFLKSKKDVDSGYAYFHLNQVWVWHINKFKLLREIFPTKSLKIDFPESCQVQCIVRRIIGYDEQFQVIALWKDGSGIPGIQSYPPLKDELHFQLKSLKNPKKNKLGISLLKSLKEVTGSVKEYFSDEVGFIRLKNSNEVVLFHLNEIWVKKEGWELFKDKQTQMLQTSLPVGSQVTFTARQIPFSRPSQLRYQAIAAWPSTTDSNGALKSFQEKFKSNKQKNKLLMSLENQYNSFKTLARLDLNPGEKDFPFVSVLINGLPQKWTATVDKQVNSTIGIIKVKLPSSFRINELYALFDIQDVYDDHGNTISEQQSLKSLVNCEVNLIARSICNGLFTETVDNISMDMRKVGKWHRKPLLQAIVVCLKNKHENKPPKSVPQPTSLHSSVKSFSTNNDGLSYCYMNYTLKCHLDRKLQKYLDLTKLMNRYCESVNCLWNSVNICEEEKKITGLLLVDTNLSSRIIYGHLDENILLKSKSSSSLPTLMKSVYCKPTSLHREGLIAKSGVVQFIMPGTFVKCFAYFDLSCLEGFGEVGNVEHDLADFIPVNSRDLFRGHFVLWNHEHRVPYITTKLWNENIRLDKHHNIPIASGMHPESEKIEKLEQLLSFNSDKISLVERVITSKKAEDKHENIMKIDCPTVSNVTLPRIIESTDLNGRLVELESRDKDQTNSNSVVPERRSISNQDKVCIDKSLDLIKNSSAKSKTINVNYAETDGVKSKTNVTVVTNISNQGTGIEIKEEKASSVRNQKTLYLEKDLESNKGTDSIMQNIKGQVVKVLDDNYAVAVVKNPKKKASDTHLVVFDVCDLCSDENSSRSTNFKLSSIVRQGSFVKLNAIQVFDNKDQPYLASAVIVGDSWDDLDSKEIPESAARISSLKTVDQEKICNFRIVARIVQNHTFSETEISIVEKITSLFSRTKELKDKLQANLTNIEVGLKIEEENQSVNFTTDLPDHVANKTGVVLFKSDAMALIKFEMKSSEATLNCFAFLSFDLISSEDSTINLSIGYPVAFHAIALTSSLHHVFVATMAYSDGSQLMKQKFMAEVQNDDWVKKARETADFTSRKLVVQEFINKVDLSKFWKPCSLKKFLVEIVKCTTDVESNQHVIILKMEHLGVSGNALYITQSKGELKEKQKVFMNALLLAENTNFDYLATAVWTDEELEVPIVEYGYISYNDVKVFHGTVNHAEEILFLTVLIADARASKHFRLLEILGKQTFSKLISLIVAYEEEILKLIEVEDFGEMRHVKAPFSLNQIITRAHSSLSEEEILELLILINRCYTKYGATGCLQMLPKSTLENIKEEGIQAVSDALPKLKRDGMLWEIPKEWNDQATTMAWEDIARPPVDDIPETWSMDLDSKLLIGASHHGLLDFGMTEHDDLWRELGDDPDFPEFSKLINYGDSNTKKFMCERLKYIKKLVMFRGRFLENMEINTEFYSCENDGLNEDLTSRSPLHNLEEENLEDQIDNYPKDEIKPILTDLNPEEPLFEEFSIDVKEET